MKQSLLILAIFIAVLLPLASSRRHRKHEEKSYVNPADSLSCQNYIQTLIPYLSSIKLIQDAMEHKETIVDMTTLIQDDFETIQNMGWNFKVYCSPEFEVPCN